MTVSELLDALRSLSGDMQVMISVDRGSVSNLVECQSVSVHNDTCEVVLKVILSS